MTIRIPRIQGSTLIAQSHPPHVLYSHIVNHYVKAGFTYLGKALSIQELSYYTHISSEDIQSGLIDSSNVYSKVLGKDNIMETLRALISGSINGSLGDKSLTYDFARRLHIRTTEGQPVGLGDKVNLRYAGLFQKALETNLKAQDNILKSISLLIPKGSTTNILIPINNGTEEADQVKGYITHKEAIELIGDKAQPLLIDQSESPEAMELYLKHGLGDIEDIIANPKDDGIGPGRAKLQPVSDIFIDDLEDLVRPRGGLRHLSAEDRARYLNSQRALPQNEEPIQTPVILPT